MTLSFDESFTHKLDGRDVAGATEMLDVCGIFAFARDTVLLGTKWKSRMTNDRTVRVWDELCVSEL